MESRPSRLPATRLIVILAIGALLGVAVYFSPAFFIPTDKDANAARLNMGGTASAFFMIDGWIHQYHEQKGIKIDYRSVGSTKGIVGMRDKNYILGFTHAPMTEKQKKEAEEKGGEIVHIPVVICAVVPIYNVKDLKWKDKDKKDTPVLNFTGDVLAGIFLGKIDKWNDPALAKLNDDVALPDAKIIVVHRGDSSGTTFIFTDYLHGASEAWRKQMGPPSAVVQWPVGKGVERNASVNDEVAQTEGAIGYVDLLYAYPDKMAYGAVQNKDKTKFIKADPVNMTDAAEGLAGQIPEDLTFNLTNRPGGDAYPICGAIWAVCYKTQPAANQKLVVDFLQWATHDGQQYAGRRSFAPLPAELVKRVEQTINSIKPAS